MAGKVGRESYKKIRKDVYIIYVTRGVSAIGREKLVVRSGGFLFIFILMLALLASADILVFGAAQDLSWPMYQQNLQHTGYSTRSAPRKGGFLLWNYTATPTDYYVLSSPAVAYGKIFIGSQNGKVYALNMSTGAQIWNYTTSSYIYSSPAVSNNIVYIGCYDGRVFALNQSTGKQIWNATAGSYIFSSPAISDGVVYIGGGDGRVYALNQNNGNKIWNFTAGDYIYSSPAVAYGKVFISSEYPKPQVFALNQSNGKKIWNYTIPTTAYSLFSSPAVADNKVILGSGSGNKTYALNQSNGAKIWEFDAKGYVYAPPTVAYGKVFISSAWWRSSWAANVFALNLSNGNKLWNFTIANGIYMYGSAVAADGMIFFPSTNTTSFSTIYALNQTNGNVVWKFLAEKNSFAYCSPAVAYGKVFVPMYKSILAFGLHNVALTNLVAPSSFTVGGKASINITVQNTGGFNENFNLTAYYNTTKIQTKLVSNLAPNASRIISFSWNTTGVQLGNYNIRVVAEVGALDNLATDNQKTSSMSIVPIPPPFPWLLVIGIAAAGGGVGAVVIYLKRRPKKVKPLRLRISADPMQIFADGKSTSTITIDLVDAEGQPAPVKEDTLVSLSASEGKIAKIVKIPKDKSSVSTSLTSSITTGAVYVTASSQSLKDGMTEVIFAEEPPRLRVSADPTEIFADGKDTSTITIELTNAEGNPLPAKGDTTVSLSSTGGRMAGSVKIPKDKSSVSISLTSSTTFGPVTITASSEGLKEAKTEVAFTEKKRYCMHCGTKMSPDSNVCPKCGRAPPSGVDVKVCKNCGEVIPSVAKFCGNCGASQPEA
jgi:outer membrane protein assembly factor BamB